MYNDGAMNRLAAMLCILVFMVLSVALVVLSRPILSRNQVATPIREIPTTNLPGVPQATTTALKVENCGRILYALPQEHQVTLVRTILSALDATHNCLSGIRQEIGVATVASKQRTFVSLFDHDDTRQANDPFNQSIYVFFVSGKDVYYQSQVDGTFSHLRDPRPLP